MTSRSAHLRRYLTTLPAVLVAAGLAAAAGCGPASEEATREPATAEPASEGAASAPGAPHASGTKPWLDDIRLGRAVGPDGGVPGPGEAKEFTAGETVYVSMAVEDAPADASVHVVYRDAAGATVSEDAKKVPAGAGHLYFDSGDTTGWPAGTYRVVVAADGDEVGDLEFRVAGASR